MNDIMGTNEVPFHIRRTVPAAFWIVAVVQKSALVTNLNGWPMLSLQKYIDALNFG
jgi:hypothetical protein